jgi:hypothetical protein
MPPALGEGLRHIPHGSDGLSRRDAGMNAAPWEASAGDAASTDAEESAQEGQATVVRMTQRHAADTLEPQGSGCKGSRAGPD